MAYLGWFGPAGVTKPEARVSSKVWVDLEIHA
jgi:hypothetical protein